MADRLFPLVEGDFVTRQKARVNKFTIQHAIQAVEHFCSQHGATLGAMTIVDITLAWHYGMTHEWTPCAPGFRRITFIAPNEMRDKVVIVDDYQGPNSEMTRQLNETIARFTHNKWAEAQK